jgi:hypothetical protein
VAEALREITGPRREGAFREYLPLSLQERRPLPAVVMGTTEAPGLFEGLFLFWLEDEIAMKNVIRATGHTDEVQRYL